MVVPLVWLIAASESPSAYSQEYTSAVEDRVDAGATQTPSAEAGGERRGGWDLGAVISVAYDDNVFLSATDPKADTVVKAAPTVAYTQGDSKEGEGGFVKAGYRPTLVVYARNDSQNRIDHEAVAIAGWRGKLTKVTYSGLFRKLGDATAETGRPTDRMALENEIRGAWIPREKVTLEAAVGNQQSDYSDPVYYDSSKTYGEVAVRYTYSPKTELGIIYQVGRFKVDGSGPQDTQQLTGSVNWQPREKIRLQLVAGAEHRKFDNGSKVSPVLEGRVEWTPRDGTGFYLSGYMREEASAYYEGQNFSVKGFTAGVSQRIRGAWSAKLEGGYESNSYQRVSGSGSSGRDDRIWFIRPAVVCRTGDESELSLYYRISADSSSDPSFGYDQQMVGVEFNRSF